LPIFYATKLQNLKTKTRLVFKNINHIIGHQSQDIN